MLQARSALPGRPTRLLVAGTSGSGKTTVARLVSTSLGVPHTEIDGLFHGPGWTPRPGFDADVRQLAALPSWVTEWQYDSARPVLAARADLLVWLDLPWPTTMRQVTLRTVRRRLRREVLWHGNLESSLWTFLTDREHIVRWAWATRRVTAPRVAALLEQRPDLPVVRLTSRREVQDWLAGPLAASAR
jgi:adenylate kinase family enzyme